MNIATIAALAVTLGLPAPAQQSATKIITENGQPALALDEQFAARLRDGGMKQGSPATVPAEFSAAAPGLPLPADRGSGPSRNPAVAARPVRLKTETLPAVERLGEIERRRVRNAHAGFSLFHPHRDPSFSSCPV